MDVHGCGGAGCGLAEALEDVVLYHIEGVDFRLALVLGGLGLLVFFRILYFGIARAPSVAPFDMCYQASALGETRTGFAVANIDLMLEGGRNWTLFGGSSLVPVSDQAVCFAFVPMVADSPDVILGGFQMENHLLLFDLEKATFGFMGCSPGSAPGATTSTSPWGAPSGS